MLCLQALPTKKHPMLEYARGTLFFFPSYAALSPSTIPPEAPDSLEVCVFNIVSKAFDIVNYIRIFYLFFFLIIKYIYTFKRTYEF